MWVPEGERDKRQETRVWGGTGAGWARDKRSGPLVVRTELEESSDVELKVFNIAAKRSSACVKLASTCRTLFIGSR